MAYFPDLSPYTYTHVGETAVNIGWLEKGQAFPTGDTSAEFRMSLAKLCQQAGRRRVGQAELFVGTLGSHCCDLCDDPSAVSSCEIRLRGWKQTYAAPQLIEHYVVVHSYLPPPEFIEAVLEWDGELYEEPEKDYASWKRRQQSAYRALSSKRTV